MQTTLAGGQGTSSSNMMVVSGAVLLLMPIIHALVQSAIGINMENTKWEVCQENTQQKVCQEQSKLSRCPTCSVDTVVLKRCSHCDKHVCIFCLPTHTDIMKQDLIKQFAEWPSKIESAEFDQKKGIDMEHLEAKVTAMQDEVDRVTESFHEVIKKRKLELYQCIEDFKTSEVDKIIAQRPENKDSYVSFCEQKPLILGGNVSQPMLVQLKDELYDKIEKLRSEDIELYDVTLCLDETVIAESLSKFGEIKDIRHVVKETKSALPPVPVAKAVPLNIDSEFTKFKIKRNVGDLKKATRYVGGQCKQPGFFYSPTAVQVSPVTGNIVVADGGNKRIQIFNPHGGFIHLFSKPYRNNRSVKQLEISNRGDIVILFQNGSIASYKENGQLIYECFVKGAISLALGTNDDVHVGIDGGGVTVMNQENVVNSYSIGEEQDVADRIFIDSSGRIFVLQFKNSSWGTRYDKLFFLNREHQLIKQINFGQNPQNIYSIGCNVQHEFQPVETVPKGSMRLISDKYVLVTDPENHYLTIYDLEWKIIRQLRINRLYDVAVKLDGDLVMLSDHMMLCSSG